MYDYGMIINIEQIKTEALLIFCKDLIISYQNSKIVVDIENEIIEKMQIQTDLILKEIDKIIKPYNFYLQNQNNFKIKAILNAHSFLITFCNKEFKNNEVFNPFILVLSILTYWFGEFGKGKNIKQYIFFSIYPFCEIYDNFFVKTKNTNYKIINLKTIEIAEELTKAYNNQIVKF
jgi:hypothetical protein